MRSLNCLACAVAGVSLQAQTTSWIVDLEKIEPPSLGANYRLTLGGDWFPEHMFFNYDETHLFSPRSADAMGSLASTFWYDAPAGNLFDPTYVESHSPFMSTLSDGQRVPIQTPSDRPFFLSFCQGVTFVNAPGISFSRFGWAKLEATPEGLTLRDQFIREGAEGVIVGVPEPATWISLVGGLLFLSGYWRLKKCQN